MAKVAKKQAEKQVKAEKTGADIFTRIVELNGTSVFVHGNETVYQTPAEANQAFEDALKKTVW